VPITRWIRRRRWRQQATSKDQGFRQKQIAQARQIVLEGVPVEGDLMRDVVALLETGRLHEADSNVFRLPTAEVAAIAGAVRAYAFALATARAGRNVTRPLPGYLHKRQWEQDGKQMFSCFVSALGYYIDPSKSYQMDGSSELLNFVCQHSRPLTLLVRMVAG